MAVLLITHDLGIVAGRADRVAVMYAGQIVEEAPTPKLFARPSHPYTQGLFASVPRLHGPLERLKPIRGNVPPPSAWPSGCRFRPRCPKAFDKSESMPPLLPLEPEHRMRCWLAENGPLGDAAPGARPGEALPVRRPLPALRVRRCGRWTACRSRLAAGETLALVGESGCGKSSVGRTILRLQEPTAGSAVFEGADLFALDRAALRRTRRRMQIIFQDPYSSLNPRMTVGTPSPRGSRSTGWRAGPRSAGGWRRCCRRSASIPGYAARYPHEFSGGQRQRIGIARALAVEPAFIVCDEPVSALDVSVQAQVLNLLADLQRDRGLSYLFIAHDLAVVRQLAHRIAVMYLGRIVEEGPAEAVLRRPTPPLYRRPAVRGTRARPGRRRRSRIVLTGDVPSPSAPPPGCPFHPRCWHPAATSGCSRERPLLRPVGRHQRRLPLRRGDASP